MESFNIPQRVLTSLVAPLHGVTNQPNCQVNTTPLTFQTPLVNSHQQNDKSSKLLISQTNYCHVNITPLTNCCYVNTTPLTVIKLLSGSILNF